MRTLADEIMGRPDADDSDLVTGPGLPGLPVGRWPAAPRPTRLLRPGLVLLVGARPDRSVDLPTHRRAWGPVESVGLDDLLAAVAGAAVVGAGGAGFPTARKLAAMSPGAVAAVVVNGAEGESASGKDAVLLAHAPHLVLDGAVAVARALRARRIHVRIGADRPDAAAALGRALDERRDQGVRIAVSTGPVGFVAGEATAVVGALSGGTAVPRPSARPPELSGTAAIRRVGRGRQVFLSNVETFARVAAALRTGAVDTALMSVSGAVLEPGVLELPAAATLIEAADAAGGVVGSPRVLISGGWHGRWLPWNPGTASTRLTREAVAAAGGRWGAGAFVWLPDHMETLAAARALARLLADGSAGQCGPCAKGLPAIADRLAAGSPDSAAGPGTEIDRLLAAVSGRGLCAHPTASAQAIRSALELAGQVRP